MYIMVTASCPMHKSQEVGEVFRKGMESPTPSFVKLHHVLVKTDEDCGMKSYAIFEVEDEKLSEGYSAIVRSSEPYGQIEGYKYSVDIMIDAIAFVQQPG